MIINNYRAMQFIQENKSDDLTLPMILELQGMLTEGTLEPAHADTAGRLRRRDEPVHVVDNRSQEILHVPPPADELPDRLDELLAFANSRNGHSFVHPVVRAIALHFAIGYIHPFFDGNGRTARALFYWCMARHGYWLIEYVSISGVIKRAHGQYGKAYLRTETDDGDLTYFVDHQLTVIATAVEELQQSLARRVDDQRSMQTLLAHSEQLKRRLNARQQMLLQHALDRPGEEYTVRGHQRSNAITYETARKDLLGLSDELGLLEKTKRGKAFVFFVPANLHDRLQNSG